MFDCLFVVSINIYICRHYLIIGMNEAPEGLPTAQASQACLNIFIKKVYFENCRICLLPTSIMCESSRVVSTHFELAKKLIFCLPTHSNFLHQLIQLIHFCCYQLIQENELFLPTQNELIQPCLRQSSLLIPNMILYTFLLILCNFILSTSGYFQRSLLYI